MSIEESERRKDNIPVGTILPYGGDVSAKDARDKLENDGWLACDGWSYSTNDYKNLYDAIGYAFGKDGDKFRVPDLRGRFARGVDHGAKRDPDADKRTSENGGNKGDMVGSVQDGDFQKHKHVQRSLQRIGDSPECKFEAWDPNREKDAKYRADNGLRDNNDEHSMIHIYTNDEPKEVFENCPSGGNETRPKNVYVNWIIKAR